MNCKKCGFPLNGNQTCPNCGEINEINNVVNNEVPQEVPTSAPVVAPVTSLTPVEPVNNVVEPKKKNTGLVIVLVIVGLLVIGTGVFLGVRTLGNKPSNSTSNNTNINNTNGEKEEKNPDAAIVKNQVFIDKMTNKEIYDLVHSTLSVDIIDGSTTKDFYQKLPVAAFGKEPYECGVRSIEITYKFFGVVLGDEQRDALDNIAFSCKYDFDTEKIYKSETKTLPKAANITFAIYSGRGTELYEYLKKQYSALYPGVEVKETTDDTDGYIDFKITTAEQKYAHARLTKKYTGKYELFVGEAVFNY